MATRTPDPVTLAFGANLRAARQAKGWSLEGLAERSGLHWTYIGQVERGSRNVSLINIVRLAQALAMPPEDLFAGIGHG